ncbi:Caleosin related protein-domain-containing protein [Mycena rebaudengoi]|nr:Caleosin related protein-domain-containing protein [Mycena rebaudengoi]
MSPTEAPTRTMSPPLPSTAMNFPGPDQGMRPLLLRPTHPHANGSTSEQQKEAQADKVDKPRTALQSHAGFFDTDNDGIIWPLDTYAEHGSDSGCYTPAGELDEHRFNYIFNLYTAPPHTHISLIEGVRMIRGNRNIFDIFGLIGAVFEWGATYAMVWPEDGRISKEDIHDVFDGSLFHRIAAKNAKTRKMH